MVPRETGFGVFASAVIVIVALPLVSCGGESKGRGNGSGSGAASGSAGSGGSGGSSGSAGSAGSGGSSGFAGGSRGGSNGEGGATGGSAATAGAGAAAGTAGGGGTGDAGSGGAAGGEESASFHWIEPTDEHRERAASSTTRALLRTAILPPVDASVLTGTSTVFTGEDLEENVTEAIVWTEATGTIGLGGLPGTNAGTVGLLSDPRAISDDGSTVVGHALDSQSIFTPFRWTRADGMEAIFEGSGTAVAVSADGSVVLGELELAVQRAFRWTRALGAVILEPLAGDDATDALALSADGATVLGQSSAAGSARLFVWTEGSGTRAVENLPGYVSCRVGLASFGRSFGFAVGGSCSDGSGGREPFLWAGHDGLVSLGPIDALGGYEPSDPVAVTADGSVAVGRSVGTGSRAYRWTEASGLELLEIPEGYTSSAPVNGPSTMSGDGSVVVGTMGGIARRSFRWAEGVGTVVLSPLEGHDLSDVYLVSADGSVAAGSSLRLGEASEILERTAIYWRADGVPHRIADELASGGVDLGGGALGAVQAVQAPLGLFGFGSKDEVSTNLGWHARLP